MSDFYELGPAGRAKAREDRRRSERVGGEQLLDAMTPLYKRNPANAQRAIERDGFAVYDGGWWHNAEPLDQPSGLRGATTDRRGASDEHSHSPH